MSYFEISQTGLNAVLERVREIERLTGLATEVGRVVVNKISAPLARLKFKVAIEQAAQEHKVDPKLISAIIEQESGFNPTAVSQRGAVGLMQLMPKTAKELGVNNPANPLENIRAGTRYFSSLLSRYHGNIALALSAYNAGPNNVDKYKGMPPFGETRNFVSSIMGKINT